MPALPNALVAFGLTLTVACARSGTTVAPVAFKPCAMAGVGAVDSSWRQVKATGFTFCVPGSWAPTGAGSDTLDPSIWKGQEGFVGWHLGRPHSMISTSQPKMAVVTGTVVTSSGMNPPPPTPIPPSPARPDESCPPPKNTPFMVDSVVVVVTQAACGGIWTTTAWSTAPEVYIQGEARSAANATVLNAVVVTIRFASVRH